MMEGLFIWLLCWSFLSCLRGLAPRFFLYRIGRHRIFFTGWTLVWEYKPRRGGGGLLPEYSSSYDEGSPNSSSSSSSLTLSRLVMSTRRRLPNGSLVTVEGMGTPVEEGGTGQFTRLYQSLRRILTGLWYRCGVIFFAIGQVVSVSFLVYNLCITLLRSNFLPLFLPPDMLKQGLETITQTRPPLPTASLALVLAAALPVSPQSPFHIATVMRPLLPGVGNNYSLFQVWLAVLLALAFHELGHALAARAEGLSIQYVGVYLAVVVPGAYVVIDERLKYLSPLSQLKVYCAGVWHNLVLCLAITAAFRLDLGSSFYLRDQGAVVSSVASTSLFKDVLLPGSAIVGLQDYAIPDTTTLTTVLELLEVDSQQRSQLWEAWRANHTTTSDYIEDLHALVVSQDVGQWGEAGLMQGGAFCRKGEEEGEGGAFPPLSSSSMSLQTCCRAGVLAGKEGSETNCFAFTTPSTTTTLACLPGRDMVVHTTAVLPGMPLPTDCHFTYHPLTLPPTSLIKLQLRSGRTIVYEGRPSQLFHGITLTDHLPRPWLSTLLWSQGLAAALAPAITSLFSALMDVSFSIGALNLVPAPHLDGSHATHHFLPTTWRPALSRYILMIGSFLLYSNVAFAAISLLESSKPPP